MTSPSERSTTASPLKRLRNFIGYIKANKQKLFWYWIGYQCIKGILTTSLIWIPLIVAWIGLK